MPYEQAPCTRPLVMQPLTTHRVQDTAAIRADLGYHDKVAPVQALQRTVDWLVANPPATGGTEEWVLEDPFDYAAEDELVRVWQDVQEQLGKVVFTTPPGIGMAYSGPGGRARSQQEFED